MFGKKRMKIVHAKQQQMTYQYEQAWNWTIFKTELVTFANSSQKEGGAISQRTRKAMFGQEEIVR
jgi:hypothetical protein